jgi:hypothetical protein
MQRGSLSCQLEWKYRQKLRLCTDRLYPRGYVLRLFAAEVLWYYFTTAPSLRMYKLITRQPGDI